MAETTQTRRIIIKVDTSGAAGLDDVAKKLDRLNKTTSDLSGGMKYLTTIFKGLAIAFVANEIRNFIQDIFQTGVELKNMSQAIGISVEDLAKLKVSAELSGVPMETLTVALRRLSVNAVAASTGNEALAASFRAFGISAADLKNLNPADILLKMSNSYKKLADDQNKAALTTKIFGRSGTDITPLLNLGSEAILKYSLHIDNEFATSAKELVNNVQLMKLELRNLSFDGFGSALPVLNEAIEKWDSFGTKNIEVGKQTKYLAGITTFLAISFKTVAAAIGEVVDILKLDFHVVIDTVAAELAILVTAIQDTWTYVKGLPKHLFDESYTPDFSNTQGAFHAYTEKLSKDVDDFTLKSKSRFFELMNFSKDLEDKLQNGYTKSPGGKDKPKADPSEINKKLAHERELLAILQAQGIEQASLQDLELRKYQLSTVAYENEKDRYKTQQDIIKATKGFDENNAQESALAKQYRIEAGLQEKAREQNRLALEEQKHGLEGVKVGATEAFRTYIDSARDTAEQTKQLFANAFKGMEDGLVNFTKTGKINFADFASAVIDDIIRIEVRMALAGLLTSVASAFTPTAPGPVVSAGGGDVAGPVYAANGGIMTDSGMMPLHNYASGGIARSPQMAIFGEGRTPEAYVPLPNGKSIPVEMNGASGGTNVSVVVNVESGSDSVTSSAEKGKALGNLMVSVIRSELIQQKRAGGILA